MNITKCPTCNAPAKMTWSGLDLVAESGDETLASKHYEFEPTALNTLLAVSGLPELYKIRNHFVTTLPTGEVTAWNMICWAKDFTRYIDEIIHEAEKAACASGAVDTVTCGVDDDGFYCQRTTKPNSIAEQCKDGCVLARNSCEG